MTRQIDITANGAATHFSFPFTVTAEAVLQVRLDNVIQDAGYTVRGIGGVNGGVVVFDNPPPSGVLVSLRHLGSVTVTAEDATFGHLSDKLIAGAGISLETVTGPGGVQSLKVNADEAADSLEKDQNLADLTDKAQARTNLGVYSKAEVEARDQAVKDAALLKVNNLSDLTDVAAGRSNLGVYGKTEVDTKDQAVKDAALLKANNLSDLANVAAARTNLEVYSKTEVESRDQAVKDAALLKANNLSDLIDAAAGRHNLGLDDVAYLTVAQDWSKPQRSQAELTAEAGGEVALDFAQYQNFSLTLTAAITFANPTLTAAIVGQKGTIGIIPAGFAITGMGSVWKRVGDTGTPSEIIGVGRIDYHIRGLDRIEYAYNDVEA